jgi:hypothetical protein
VSDPTISPSSNRTASSAARDKLGLKINRFLALRLQQHGLWIADHRYHQVLTARKTLGNRLQEQIQLPFVSPEILATTSFGSERRFRSNCNRCLAFGFEMSFGFRGFLTGNYTFDPESALLGAIFNLGIARFDRVFDHLPGGATNLASLFDENLLRRLCAGESSQAHLAVSTANASGVEIRFLLGIISLFFARLEQFSRLGPHSGPRQTLNDLLLRAYRAQIACARICSVDQAPDTALLAVKEKSVLPFSVLLQLVRVCDPDVQVARDASADCLAGHVATAFWLIDDLVDLKSDFRNGHANAVLLQRAHCPVTPIGLVARSKVVESVADQICTSLTVAQKAFQQAGVRSTSGHGFDEALLSYVRKWVERG